MLVGNLEVAAGDVIAPTVQQSRDESAAATHFEQAIAADSETGWRFVADNLKTRVSTTLVVLKFMEKT